MENVPWIEKYRPSDFNNIVLDATNKKILLNIVKKIFSKFAFLWTTWNW